MADPVTPPSKTWTEWFEDLLRGWIPSFSLGSVAELGIVGVIFYFLMRFEPVQDFIRSFLPEGGKARLWFDGALEEYGGGSHGHFTEDLLGLSAKDAQEQLKGRVPDAIIQIIAADDKTWHEVVQLVVDAKGDIMNPLSDTVIFQMITKRPDLVQKIINVLPKPAPGTAPDETTTKVLTALRAIVKDGRFDTLLKTQPDLIMGAFERFSPIPFVPGALGNFVKTTLLNADGTTSPAVRSFLDTALAGEKGGMSKAFIALLTADSIKNNPNTPTAIATLLASVNVNDPAVNTLDPGIVKMIVLLNTPQNVDAAIKLLNKLGPDKAVIFMDILQKGDMNGMLKFTTDPANAQDCRDFTKNFHIAPVTPELAAMDRVRQQFATNSDAENLALHKITVENETANATSPLDLAKLPQSFMDANGHLSAERAVGGIFDPQLRVQLWNIRDGLGDYLAANVAGTKGVEHDALAFVSTPTTTNGHTHYANLEGIFQLVDNVSNDAVNRKNADACNNVLHALIARCTGNDTTALDQLGNGDMMTFMQNRKNWAYVQNFFHQLDLSKLSKPQQAFVNAFRDNCTNAQGNGLFSALSNPAEVSIAMDGLRGHSTGYIVMHNKPGDLLYYENSNDKPLIDALAAAADAYKNAPPASPPAAPPSGHGLAPTTSKVTRLASASPTQH